MHLNNSKINTMKINYIRVSTGTQSKEVQEFNLSSEYKVFKEVVSGSIAFAQRTEGAKIIQLVKEKIIMKKNESIGCTVTECRNHTNGEQYCSLEKIQVVKHNASANTVEHTDCGSFASK